MRIGCPACFEGPVVGRASRRVVSDTRTGGPGWFRGSHVFSGRSRCENPLSVYFWPVIDKKHAETGKTRRKRRLFRVDQVLLGRRRHASTPPRRG